MPSKPRPATVGTYGTFDIDAAGNWTYTRTSDLDEMNAGDELTDSFTVVSADGTANELVTITITGVNDDASISGDLARTTDEDTASETGTLIVSDVDAGESLLVAQTASVGNHGTLDLEANGNWTYTLNTSSLQSLNATEQVLDSFDVMSLDGTTSQIEITIEGLNDAPEAGDDTAATNEDTEVVIDVMNNDMDADGDTITPSIAVGATNGLVTVNANGTISYRPDENFNGIDSFVYAVTDSSGLLDTATVTVTVHSVNDGPVAVDDLATVDGGQSVLIDLTDNDLDVEGGIDVTSITIMTPPAHGLVVDNGDGTVTYTNTDPSATSDTFTYQVFDAEAAVSNEATVTIAVESSDAGADVNLVNGELRIKTTQNDDTVLGEVIGTEFVVTVSNAQGSTTYEFDNSLVDRVKAKLKGGDDVFDMSTINIPMIVIAGDGDDTVTTGGGSDDVKGGEGNDTITTGDGADMIRGNSGDDQIFAGDGADDIRGNKGADLIDAGAGNDDVSGGAGDDIIDGGLGNDYIIGNQGNDTLTGGDGDDCIHGKSGDDTIDAGSGADFVYGNSGADVINAGSGHDFVHAGSGDDLLIGGLGNDVLFAGAGADILVGGDGYDWLDAGSGRDILIGGRDSDLLQGRGGDDILVAGYTSFDSDLIALQMMRNEWTSDRSYQQRIENLSGQGSGPNENGSVYLLAGGNEATVFDDGCADLVFGNSGMDWFFYGEEDIDDQRLDEIFENDLGELLV